MPFILKIHNARVRLGELLAIILLLEFVVGALQIPTDFFPGSGRTELADGLLG